MTESLYSGRAFRTLNLIDEGNRQVLGIEVAHSIPSLRVIRVMERLIELFGKPHALRLGQWTCAHLSRLHRMVCRAPLAQVRKRGSDGLLVQADVLSPEQIMAMFRKVQGEFRTLDVFVSNAQPEASAFFQPPLDITLKQRDTAFDSLARRSWSGAPSTAGHE